MEKEIQEADNPFDAWNNTQIIYAQEATKSYCELYLFNEFEKALTFRKGGKPLLVVFSN